MFGYRVAKIGIKSEEGALQVHRSSLILMVGNIERIELLRLQVFNVSKEVLYNHLVIVDGFESVFHLIHLSVELVHDFFQVNQVFAGTLYYLSFIVLHGVDLFDESIFLLLVVVYLLL